MRAEKDSQTGMVCVSFVVPALCRTWLLLLSLRVVLRALQVLLTAVNTERNTPYDNPRSDGSPPRAWLVIVPTKGSSSPSLPRDLSPFSFLITCYFLRVATRTLMP